MDVKLGFRMLIKYPGLTLIGSLAMAFAIAVGAAAFEFLNQVVHPTLPLHDGHRIVGIRLWHTETNGVEEQALYDFTIWRGRLQSIDDLGVFRTVERNLIGADVPGEPIMTAEISASGFTVARVPALLGRTLVEADEQADAPPVVVIGHNVWQSRFAGTPAVIGRTVQVGTVQRTVVGVMPEGFGFPRTHSLWIPLRLSELQFARRQGPWVFVFGRLAPGMSLEEAQSELTTFGRRAAAEFPDTHEHIRPEVLPYAQSVSPIFGELSPNTLLSLNLFFVFLMVLVCANVALLMFARAAARQNELLVRTALGASRGRIAGQLFGEALALGSVALFVGLSVAGFALRGWLEVSRLEDHGRLPFWHDDRLAATTVLYAALLTILGAVLSGVIPAVKATGRGLEARLRERSAGGGGLQFGGVWTAVIVTQVALTVAFPATAYFVRQSILQTRSVEAGFDADQYLSASLEMDPEFSRGADGVIRAEFPETRFRTTLEALAVRLSAEPGVAGVTFTDRRPLGHHRLRRIELESSTRPTRDEPPRAATASVGLNFFDVLGASLQAGRSFHAGDLSADARAVIVNVSFVNSLLGGRNAIGVRLRELPEESRDAPAGPWLEIVGVMPDLGVIADAPGEAAAYYRPVRPGAVRPNHVVMHVRGDLAPMSARLHAIAAAVDPTLRLHAVAPVSEGDPTLWLEFDFLFTLLMLVSAMALLLSMAGIYAALSFAVSRRTREIGIRVAMGASAARVAMAIFSRPVAQVGTGVLLGVGLTAALAIVVTGGVTAAGIGLVAAYATLMLGVCLLPSVTPVRAALRVDATEALRAEQ